MRVAVVVVGASNTMLPNLSGLALPGGGGGPVAPMETAGIKEMKARLAEVQVQGEKIKTKLTNDPRFQKHMTKLMELWASVTTNVIKLVSAKGSAAVDKAIDLANFFRKNLHPSKAPFDAATIQNIRNAVRNELKSTGTGSSFSLNGPMALDTGTPEEDKNEDAGKQLAIDVIFDFVFCLITFCLEYTDSGENLTNPTCYARWGLA